MQLLSFVAVTEISLTMHNLSAHVVFGAYWDISQVPSSCSTACGNGTLEYLPICKDADEQINSVYCTRFAKPKSVVQACTRGCGPFIVDNVTIVQPDACIPVGSSAQVSCINGYSLFGNGR
ncbi:hypothetical protein GUITHDRAFT_103687 [Guillardia theta CCMP2712]|uniref:Uncharacterized protein n=1 Tax=Guillardia theta (strain CCMP2712) TaxID=905079 RepID=L1JQT7_GUITC|nr:hypothetical protein GUITHDRAFT_103687 [Guillardia theta CCMP2712]EKX50453.1 hypothetical protein GUITHDRAFT_103687 [Guillardia theta CCMP2712]|eukprot:XP_005837433.1 hypothetical protein GUITHDRAFT_103687 [Guillardia theta CCMP2712]